MRIQVVAIGVSLLAAAGMVVTRSAQDTRSSSQPAQPNGQGGDRELLGQARTSQLLALTVDTNHQVVGYDLETGIKSEVASLPSQANAYLPLMNKTSDVLCVRSESGGPYQASQNRHIVYSLQDGVWHERWRTEKACWSGMPFFIDDDRFIVIGRGVDGVNEDSGLQNGESRPREFESAVFNVSTGIRERRIVKTVYATTRSSLIGGSLGGNRFVLVQSANDGTSEIWEYEWPSWRGTKLANGYNAIPIGESHIAYQMDNWICSMRIDTPSQVTRLLEGGRILAAIPGKLEILVRGWELDRSLKKKMPELFQLKVDGTGYQKSACSERYKREQPFGWTCITQIGGK